MRRIAPALLLVLALAPAPARPANDASSPGPEPGPLRFRDRYALGLGFLAFEPAPASVAAPGEWQLDATFTSANTWALSPALEIELDGRAARGAITIEELEELTVSSRQGALVFVDAEVSRAALSLRRGFARGFQVELTIPLLRLSGGGLDGLVESFHETLGLDQAGRLGATKDDLWVFLDAGRSRLVQREGASLAVGDLLVSARYRLLPRRQRLPGLAVEGVVKLPTGGDQPLISSGSADLGVRLLAGSSRGPWSLHGSAGVLLLGPSERLGIGSQRLFAGLLGVERRLGARTSLVLQGSVSQSPFKELGTSRIGKRSLQATTGIKRILGPGTVLLAGVTENFENFNNSADIDLHLGISQTLRGRRDRSARP